jgi:hypothetical protein
MREISKDCLHVSFSAMIGRAAEIAEVGWVSG